MSARANVARFCASGEARGTFVPPPPTARSCRRGCGARSLSPVDRLGGVSLHPLPVLVLPLGEVALRELLGDLVEDLPAEVRIPVEVSPLQAVLERPEADL